MKRPQRQIRQNPDGTYSWVTENGFLATSCVLPYEERWTDRSMFGYGLLSYSLWARTILRVYWKTYVSPVPPKFLTPKKPQRVVLQNG